jgi:hypothetical protein
MFISYYKYDATVARNSADNRNVDIEEEKMYVIYVSLF